MPCKHRYRPSLEHDPGKSFTSNFYAVVDSLLSTNIYIYTSYIFFFSFLFFFSPTKVVDKKDRTFKSGGRYRMFRSNGFALSRIPIFATSLKRRKKKENVFHSTRNTSRSSDIRLREDG